MEGGVADFSKVLGSPSAQMAGNAKPFIAEVAEDRRGARRGFEHNLILFVSVCLAVYAPFGALYTQIS